MIQKIKSMLLDESIVKPLILFNSFVIIFSLGFSTLVDIFLNPKGIQWMFNILLLIPLIVFGSTLIVIGEHLRKNTK